MGKASQGAAVAWKLALFLSLALPAAAQDGWKKHVIVQAGKPLTAVAADFTGDGRVDVITNVESAVRLYVAPDWREVVLPSLVRNTDERAAYR